MEEIAEEDSYINNIKFPNKGKLFSVSLAHMFNDWYANYIQTLLPFMVLAGLSISKGAYLISAFTVTSSILQPFFGYLVDQKNQRWMVYVGTAWTALLLSFVGIVDNYTIKFILAAFAGLGTAAFHPQASAMVSAICGEKKAFFQAIFISFGNIGIAITPLMVVPYVKAYGLKSTLIFAIPGLLVAVLLWFTAPKTVFKKANPVSAFQTLKENWNELSKIVSVVAIRSLTYFGLIAFLPLYLIKEKHISISESSYIVFVMLFSGALGGIIGGHLSDKFGKKIVIISSLILSCPFFYLFLEINSPFKYLFLIMAGASLLASFSVTIIAAQEIISKNAAMASGLMLGFGVGIGGLGVSIIGLLAEHAGINYSIHLLIFLPLLAGLLGFGIKEVKK